MVQIVPVNGQVTISYPFVPRAELRPMDLFFTFTMVYETPPIQDPQNPDAEPTKRQLAHIVFNSTVSVVEGPGKFSTPFSLSLSPPSLNSCESVYVFIYVCT